MAGNLVLAQGMKRKVEFRRGRDGNPTHDTVDGPVLFQLDLTYLNSSEMAEIQQSAVQRTISNAKKKMKVLVPDARAGLLLVVNKAVSGWGNLDRAALRALESQIDFKKLGMKPGDLLEYTPENVEKMVAYSIFGGIVLLCLQDYEFWFPDDEDQLGNFESGADTSTVPKPAGSA